MNIINKYNQLELKARHDVLNESFDKFIKSETEELELKRINLEKDVALAGAYRVVIGCKDEKVKEQVVKEISSLPDDIRSRAVVCRLSEVFKLKLEELIKKEE